MGTIFGISVLLVVTHAAAAVAGAIFLPELWKRLTSR